MDGGDFKRRSATPTHRAGRFRGLKATATIIRSLRDPPLHPDSCPPLLITPPNRPAIDSPQLVGEARAMKFQIVLAVFGVATFVHAGEAEFQDTVRLYTSERSAVGRFYDLPWSDMRFDRFDRLYRDWQGRLPQLDFDALSQQGRVDYVLLRNEIEAQSDQQKVQQARLKEMDELLSFRGPVQELEAGRWKLKSFAAQDAATKISELAERVSAIKGLNLLESHAERLETTNTLLAQLTASIESMNTRIDLQSSVPNEASARSRV